MNNFSIFKAKEKKNETSPDYNISIKKGEEYVNAGACWIKDGKAGKYMSCKLSEPFQARAGFDIIELPAPIAPIFNKDSQGNKLKGNESDTMEDTTNTDDIPF